MVLSTGYAYPMLNYHSDLKGGQNNILAIMFDMNQLWESYIYYSLKRSARFFNIPVVVEGQCKRVFWRHPEHYDLRLKPDIILRSENESNSKAVVIDTKWKYRSDTSIADVRQMYAYGRYFQSDEVFLLYPGRLSGNSVEIKPGTFYKPGEVKVLSQIKCGLIFTDIIKDGKLNKELGKDILERCFDIFPATVN